MRLLLAVAVVSLTSAGCVSMDVAECRAANWYDLGFRDGLAGLQRKGFGYDEEIGRRSGRPGVGACGEGGGVAPAVTGPRLPRRDRAGRAGGFPGPPLGWSPAG